MSRVFWPSKVKENVNGGLYRHKMMPSFPQLKGQEFQPAHPCGCFTPHQMSDHVSEALGVQDLLHSKTKVSDGHTNMALLHHTLQELFQSVQIHRGQIELLLQQITSPVIFVVKFDTQWDPLIVQYVLLEGLKRPITFLNCSTSHEDSFRGPCARARTSSRSPLEVLFINLDGSDAHFTDVVANVASGDGSDVVLIAVSLSYEFPPPAKGSKDLCGWKPDVRINFGLPHSFLEFMNQKANQDCVVRDLKKHLSHEIWRNTAIFSGHLVSLLMHYRLRNDSSASECAPLMNEFQCELRQSFDLAFVGEIDVVSDYSLKLFSVKKDTMWPCVALDAMKYESLMMKSVLSVMKRVDVDYQTETCRISEKMVLEEFRGMAKILRYELDYIFPPCTDPTVVEAKALEILCKHSVASRHSSEPLGEDVQKARRMAQHLELDFEDEDGDDWGLLAPSSIDVSLYVNINNALSRKWVAHMASSLLEIYYVAARQLLELHQVEVMEDEVFLRDALDKMEKIASSNISAQLLTITLKNALKLFTDEGIIGTCRRSNVMVIYIKDPLDQSSILSLIHELAQFIE